MPEPTNQDTKGNDGKSANNQLLEEKIKAIEKERDDFKKQLESLKSTSFPADKSLNEKVKDEADAKDKRELESKTLETALKFNLTSDKFINENKSVLPKEIGDIFAAAEKEKFDSAIDRANATKAAIIQSFFSLQANVDLTTPSQRQSVEDYLKLTKKGKEERADEVYRNVFEPTLEMIKRIKRAEESSKSKEGYSEGSDLDKAYKEKLIKGSRQHFLGEK